MCMACLGGGTAMRVNFPPVGMGASIMARNCRPVKSLCCRRLGELPGRQQKRLGLPVTLAHSLDLPCLVDGPGIFQHVAGTGSNRIVEVDRLALFPDYRPHPLLTVLRPA